MSACVEKDRGKMLHNGNVFYTLGKTARKKMCVIRSIIIMPLNGTDQRAQTNKQNNKQTHAEFVCPIKAKDLHAVVDGVVVCVANDAKRARVMVVWQQQQQKKQQQQQKKQQKQQ